MQFENEVGPSEQATSAATSALSGSHDAANENLASWASAPLTSMDPARAGNTNLASDPQWANCLAGAVEHAADDKENKSIIKPADGLTSWPGAR